MKNQEYVGRVASVPGNDGYGFIGIASIAHSDGSVVDSNELELGNDIFIHQDDCASPLRVGMTVTFDVTPDHKRGTGHYRALSVVEFAEPELVPANEPPMTGFTALAPFGAAAPEQKLSVPATPAQRRMKAVPTERVEQALANRPAPTIPRDSSVPLDRDELMRFFLAHLFPVMEQFGTDFRLDGDDAALDGYVEQARTDMESLGMQEQIPVMNEQVTAFKSFRGALSFMLRENIVRRDTIIPIEYLPDFFTAVPVWYFVANESNAQKSKEAWSTNDPTVHDSTKYFCDLFPNQNWADVFQMFNRRFRTLGQYKGDILPPHVLRRVHEASKLFDYVVIMTPYVDVAGKDWGDLNWIRSIDPYVVGFKKGVPYFFIIARFSDSGTFPLFAELVADTVAFLKENRAALKGFNGVNNTYWHGPVGPNSCVLLSGDFTYFPESKLGSHLQEVTGKFLEAFEAGNLFDWLRGQPATEQTKN